MPPLPPAGNVLRVTFDHTAGEDTKIGSRIFLAYTGGPPSTGDCNALAADFSSNYLSHLASLLYAGNTMDLVTVQDLSSATANYGTSTTVVDGTRSGSPNPINVCVLLNYLLARKYRGGKPRGYWPWGVEGDLANVNTWTSAFIGQINSGFGTFITGCTSSSSGTTDITAHVNVSYYSGFTTYTGSGGRPKVRNTPRSTPLVGNITNHVANNFIGTQRRRIRATGG